MTLFGILSLVLVGSLLSPSYGAFRSCNNLNGLVFYYSENDPTVNTFSYYIWYLFDSGVCHDSSGFVFTYANCNAGTIITKKYGLSPGCGGATPSYENYTMGSVIMDRGYWVYRCGPPMGTMANYGMVYTNSLVSTNCASPDSAWVYSKTELPLGTCVDHWGFCCFRGVCYQILNVPGGTTINWLSYCVGGCTPTTNCRTVVNAPIGVCQVDNTYPDANYFYNPSTWHNVLCVWDPCSTTALAGYHLATSGCSGLSELSCTFTCTAGYTGTPSNSQPLMCHNGAWATPTITCLAQCTGVPAGGTRSVWRERMELWNREQRYGLHDRLRVWLQRRRLLGDVYQWSLRQRDGLLLSESLHNQPSCPVRRERLGLRNRLERFAVLGRVRDRLHGQRLQRHVLARVLRQRDRLVRYSLQLRSSWDERFTQVPNSLC